MIIDKLIACSPVKLNSIAPKFQMSVPIKSGKDIFEKSCDVIFSKETFEKAKNIVAKTVRGNDPKESVAIIMNNKIIYQGLGGETSVNVPKEIQKFLYDPKNKIAILHSHPAIQKHFTQSFSFKDYYSLITSQGVKKMYVVNSNGEYALFEKINNQRPENKTISKYKKLYYDSMQEAVDLANEYLKFMEKIHAELKAGSEKLNNSDIKYSKEQLEYFTKLGEKYHELSDLRAKVVVKASHDFWDKHAKDLNVKYRANFSYL